jgi:large subunit ribosomal protein L23
MDSHIVLKPRLSEKAYGLSTARNVYVFDVPAGTNKHSVARAVTSQFSVVVTGVNLTNIKGKAKATVYKKRRGPVGKQNDVRKAYVTLAAGNSLPFFQAIEEAEAKDVKAAEAAAKALEKADKKAAKEDKKGSK